MGSAISSNLKTRQTSNAKSMTDELKIGKVENLNVDGDARKLAWEKTEGLILRDAMNGGEIKENQAKVKTLWSDEGLFVLWVADDEHIWGTYRKDDEPIYNEEVVEIFIAAGAKVPKKYFEFQFSPHGVKFDAKISNPTGSRHDEGFRVDVGWSCNGLKFAQKIDAKRKTQDFQVGRWITEAFIPWRSIGAKGVGAGSILRANLFRIDGYPKQESFQAWIPTLKDPPDFHMPEKFGYIKLV